MGPLLFKFFINDIFYFIEHGTLYNYADDNTLSYADQDYNTLINVLEKESSILLNGLMLIVSKPTQINFKLLLLGRKLMQKNLFLILSLLIYHVMKL
jgi:hypothetical protein